MQLHSSRANGRVPLSARIRTAPQACMRPAAHLTAVRDESVHQQRGNSPVLSLPYVNDSQFPKSRALEYNSKTTMTTDTSDSTPATTGSSHGTEEVKDGDIHLDNAALDGLNTAEALSLHQLMNDLTSCGVGSIVDLPQIIVVGEQSSGKSSVLEAITRVRFPVASDVCTRFATEIVIRKGPLQKVDVKIRFSGKREKVIKQRGFSVNNLPEIIEKAKVLMGLASENNREFSKDVLHIEVEGPDMSPLTLIDLPGIFHVENEKQSKDGIKMVKELADTYMKQKNSIILLVIEAHRGVASHAALKMAEEADVDRRRTLGVITKPDRASKDEATAHIKLAKNQDSTHKLGMGWHVLRNLESGVPEVDVDDLDARDAKEAAYFMDPPWSSITETDRGIGYLRTKLSKILYKHTQQSIQGVIDDIEKKLEERREELKQYGVERTGAKEMLVFLVGLCSEFEKLTRAAIDGNYQDNFFGNLTSPENRLRAELRSFHRVFDYTMKTRGQQYIIESRDKHQTDYEEELYLTDTLTEFLEQRPYNRQIPPLKSREEINHMLQKLAVENVGNELPGSCNSKLAIQLFQELSTPWKDITKYHIDNVLAVSRDFVQVLFKHLMGEQNTYPALEVFVKEHIDPFFQEIQHDLDKKRVELLDPYTEGYAVPLDAEFSKLVKRWVAERLARSLRSTPELKVESPKVGGTQRPTQEALARAIEINQVSDGGTFATERILDMAEAYYEMARRTFTDNVMNLAIERCLVRRLPEIFPAKKLAEIKEEKLIKVAAEPAATSARRRQLQDEITTLEQGLSKCKSWQPLPTRNSLGTTASSKKARDNNALAQVKMGKAKAESENQLPLPKTESFWSPPAPGPTPASTNPPSKKAPPVTGLAKPVGDVSKGDKSQTLTTTSLCEPGSSTLNNTASSSEQASPFAFLNASPPKASSSIFSTPSSGGLYGSSASTSTINPPGGQSTKSGFSSPTPPSSSGFSFGSSTRVFGKSSNDGPSSAQANNSESRLNTKWTFGSSPR